MNTCIKKKVIAIVWGIILFLLIFPFQAVGQPVRLGVAVVRTGELASYGISALRGVQMAVEEINAAGGIHKSPVELLVEDDMCLPKEALIAASRLMEKKVHAVIGHTCSGATFAALEIYKDAGILTISPSATNPDLTQSENYPNFFRTIASDDTQALVQIEFIINRLGLRRVAIIHDKSVYGKGLAEYARQILEKTDKNKIAMYEGVRTGTMNATQTVGKIKRSKADVVIYGGYHPGASKIVQQMRFEQMDTVFISGDGVKDDAFIASCGKAAEGVYATAPQDMSAIPMAVTVTNRYRALYGEEPGPFFLNAYAAVLVLANAMKDADSLELDAVARVLRSRTVETPIGRIGFDNRGDATGTGFSVFQVRNGVFVELK